MRSMSDILADGVIRAGSASGGEASASAGADHQQAGGGTPPAPAAAAKESPQAQDQGEDAEAEQVPDDLDGLKRALAAARGDKRKARKAYREVEAQLAELRGRISVYQQHGANPAPAGGQKPQGQQQSQEPDISDEDWYGKGPAAVKAYIAAMRQRDRQEADLRRLNASEKRALKNHADFEQKLDLFKKHAPPHVVKQMLEEDDPAEFAYDYANTLDQIKDTPTLDDLRKKIRAEIEAEMAAKNSGAVVDQPQAKPPIPRSLAGARGNGAGGNTTKWVGPRPMGEILK